MYRPNALLDRLREVLDPAPNHVATPGSRLAAVLIPVLAGGPEPRIVFTRRTDTLSRHPGEISFPGGLLDIGEDLPTAALRETEEELGLLRSDVELLGALPPVHTHVSGILVVPFVGVLWSDPSFTPNAAEIADVLEFPLAALAEVAAEEEFERNGFRFTTFVFPMDGHMIWGATARILRSFIDALDETSGGKAEDVPS